LIRLETYSNKDDIVVLG